MVLNHAVATFDKPCECTRWEWTWEHTQREVEIAPSIHTDSVRNSFAAQRGLQIKDIGGISNESHVLISIQIKLFQMHICFKMTFKNGKFQNDFKTNFIDDRAINNPSTPVIYYIFTFAMTKLILSAVGF